jgi:hypothetical protein
MMNECREDDLTIRFIYIISNNKNNNKNSYD